MVGKQGKAMLITALSLAAGDTFACEINGLNLAQRNFQKHDDSWSRQIVVKGEGIAVSKVSIVSPSGEQIFHSQIPRVTGTNQFSFHIPNAQLTAFAHYRLRLTCGADTKVVPFQASFGHAAEPLIEDTALNSQVPAFKFPVNHSQLERRLTLLTWYPPGREDTSYGMSHYWQVAVISANGGHRKLIWKTSGRQRGPQTAPVGVRLRRGRHLATVSYMTILSETELKQTYIQTREIEFFNSH